MNERVQALIEQVGTDVSGKWISVDDAEKLTELIVQECAWLVDENDISLPYGTFGKLIKGHFGVEK
jgi:hypothetical protein